LEYFGEYARDLAEDNYALFAGLSGFKDNFSYSLEYRNYQNFSLGAGINEPPAGVKQQTHLLRKDIKLIFSIISPMTHELI